MTKKEFKDLIATSNEPEWFNTVVMQINFLPVNFNQTFTGMTSIFDFYDQQLKGWEKITDNLPQQLVDCKTFFLQKKQQLIDVSRILIPYNLDQCKSYWNQNVSQFNSQGQQFVFCYNSSETLFLINLNNNKPEWFLGAYNFITGQSLDVNDKNAYIGSILAYEFYTKDLSDIVGRKKIEKASLNDLKNDFQSYLSESSTQLTGHLIKANDEYKTYVESLEELKREKDLSIQEWFTASKETFTNFDQSSQTKISDLEKLYREKLMLEAPAQYWETRAEKLKKTANKWLTGLIITTIIGLITVICVVNSISTEGGESIFKNGKGIRILIGYLTLISFVAFLIRTFTKLTFSTFHLVRDAEERHQLTYVYLALKENGAVSDADRQIILQSIFSRADSGLLKEDSSPTMPNPSFIEKITGSGK